MKKRKQNWLLIFIAPVAVLFTGMYAAACFGPNTCGPSDSDMCQYLEDCFGRENVEVLKTAQKGRIKAVLYRNAQWGDPDKGFIMIFERRLFGLRWRQAGMNGFTSGEDKLYSSYSWRQGNCVIEVFGDNRSGAVEGYSMPGIPKVQRDNLESDYILDIYLMYTVEPPSRTLQSHLAEN